MAEYIDSEAVLDKIRYRVCQGNGYKEHICKRGSCAYCGIMEIMDDISSIPAADVQPICHGYWIAENRDNRGYADCYTCSNCQNYTYTYTLMKDCEYEYCHNCGARMDGDTNG